MQQKTLPTENHTLEEARIVVNLAIKNPRDYQLRSYEDSNGLPMNELPIIQSVDKSLVGQIVNAEFEGCFPLLNAIYYRRYDVADYFLKMPGIDVNVHSKTQPPPLMMLLGRDNTETIAPLFYELIQKGADTNIIYTYDDGGEQLSMLSEAVRNNGIYGHMTLIDLLLKRNPSALSLRLALKQAISARSLPLIQKLISKGAVLADL